MTIDTRQAIGACPRAADLAAPGRKDEAREEKVEGKMVGSVVINDAAEDSLYQKILKEEKGRARHACSRRRGCAIEVLAMRRRKEEKSERKIATNEISRAPPPHTLTQAEAVAGLQPTA